MGFSWPSRAPTTRPDQADRHARPSTAKKAADECGEQQQASPGHHKARSGRQDAFLGDRNSRLEVSVSGVQDVGVAVTDHQGDAPERTRFDHPAPVRFKPSEALHIALHGGALTTGEIVRIAAQARDCALRRLPMWLWRPHRSARSPASIRRSRHRGAGDIAARIPDPGRRRGAQQAASESADPNDTRHRVLLKRQELAARPVPSRRTGSRRLCRPGSLPRAPSQGSLFRCQGKPGSLQAISLTAKAGRRLRLSAARPNP